MAPREFLCYILAAGGGGQGKALQGSVTCLGSHSRLTLPSSGLTVVVMTQRPSRDLVNLCSAKHPALHLVLARSRAGRGGADRRGVSGWRRPFGVLGLLLEPWGLEHRGPPGKQRATTGSKQDQFLGFTLSLQGKMVFVLRREAGRTLELGSSISAGLPGPPRLGEGMVLSPAASHCPPGPQLSV